MAEKKVTEFYLKLKLDAASFKSVDNELKKLAKSFKSLESKIEESSKGIQSKIRMAFFGKTGSKTTISSFFRTEFKNMATTIGKEFKSAMTTVAAQVQKTNDAEFGKIVNTMIKHIQSLEKQTIAQTEKTKKSVAKSAANMAAPFGAKYLSAKEYRSVSGNQAFRQQPDLSKSGASGQFTILTQEQIKANNMALEQEKYIAKEMMKIQKQQSAYWKSAFNESVKSITAGKSKVLTSMADYYKNLEKVSKSSSLNNIKLKKTEERKRAEDLMNRIKEEQAAYRQLKKMQADSTVNKVNPFARIGQEFKDFITDVSNKISKFFGGLQKSFGALWSIGSRLWNLLKGMVKTIGILGVVGVGAMTGLGMAMKKFGSDIIFATDKMRGFEIGLLGMMKTMPAVNRLMEASFEVAEKLPISFEQVYQSTKAFALIGPLRTMLQDSTKVHETLTDAYQVIMALSQIEPEWGIAGAQFSLREALSGDLRSLQRRFEIPVNLIFDENGRSIRDMKNDPEAMLKTLANYLGDFYDEESLERASRQFSVQLSKLEGEWFKFQQAIGQSGFYDKVVDKLIEIRKQIELFTKTPAFNDLAKSISNSLSSMFESTQNILKGGASAVLGLLGIKSEDDEINNIKKFFEIIAGTLRGLEKTLMSDQLKVFIKSMYEESKKTLNFIVKEVTTLFNGVKADLKLVSGILDNTLMPIVNTLLGLGDSNISKRGLFYLFLFGPSNILALFQGFKASLMAIISLMKMLGVAATTTLAKIIALPAMVYFAVDNVANAWDFIFESIDKKLESSSFYQVYAWWTGAKTTQMLELELNTKTRDIAQYVSANKFDSKLQQDIKLSSIGYSGSRFDKIQKLSSGNNVEQLLIQDIKENKQFYEMFADKLQERAMFGGNNEDSKELTKVASSIRTLIDGIDDYTTINKKYIEQADMNKNYESEYKLAYQKVLAAIEGGVSGIYGSVKEYLQPMEAAGQAHLKAVASIVNADKHPQALSGLAPEAKILGASLLQQFKSAGFTPVVTSGYREGDKGSHGQGQAIDYQLQLNGKPLTTQVLESESFIKFIKDIKGAEGIRNVILEQGQQAKISDDVMKAIGQDPKLKNAGDSSNQFATIHVEFEKYADNQEKLVKDMGLMAQFSNLFYSTADNIKKEIDKGSAIVNGKSNSEPYESLKEFELFVKRPLEQTKQQLKTYKQFSDILKESNVIENIDDFFKQYDQDNIAKIGEKKVREIKEAGDNVKQKINEIGRVNLVIDSFLKSIEDQKFVKNDKNFVEKSYTVASNTYEFIKDLVMLPSKIDEQVGKDVERTQQVSIQTWKDNLKKKTYQFIQTSENSAADLERELKMTAFSEAFAKVSMDSDIRDVESLTSLSSAFEEVLTKLYFTKATISEIRNEFIKDKDDPKLKAFKETTLDMAEALEKENGARFRKLKLIKSEIAAIQKVTSLRQLEAKWSDYVTNSSKEVRDAGFTRYKEFLAEGEKPSGGVGDAFVKGIQESQSEWLKTSELMYETGKQLNDNLTATFEDGFFNTMTKGISSIGDMFKNLWDVVKNTILGIISKMAAISATKLVLGIDIQGGITGGSGSGGGLFGGLVNKLIGGLFDGSSGSSTSPYGDIVSSLISSGGGISKSVGAGAGNLAMNTVMASLGAGGGISGDLLASAVGAKIAGGAATKGGILGKASNFLKTYKTPLLIAGAVTSFLTQPGRLFGGTKDKTGAAQSSYALWTERKKAMEERRSTDALNYYMGGDTSGIANYGFGGIGYSTWSSGDGRFKGPKEKHAATDPSAYINSLKKYMEMVNEAGKIHYDTMFKINKLSETNQMKALQMQSDLDNKKLQLIRDNYNKAAAADLADPENINKLDEWRDNLLNSEYEYRQLQDQILKLEKETGYKRLEYLDYVKWSGENQIASMKTAISIEQDRMKEYEANTMEWYDAKLSLMQSEKELADTLRNISKQTQEAINSNLKSVYMIGGDLSKLPIDNITTQTNSWDYSSFGSSKFRPTGNVLLKEYDKVGSLNQMIKSVGDLQKGENIDYIFNNFKDILGVEKIMKSTGFSKITQSEYFGDSGAIRGDPYADGYYNPTAEKQKEINSWGFSRLDELKEIGATDIELNLSSSSPYIKYTTTIEQMIEDYNITIEEAIEKLNTEIQNTITKYSIMTNMDRTIALITDTLSGIDNGIYNQFTQLKNSYDAVISDKYMDSDTKEITLLELDNSLQEFYLGLADSVRNFIDTGYISEDSDLVNSFRNAVKNGFDETATVLYDSIRIAANENKFKLGAISGMKDMDDLTNFQTLLTGDSGDVFREMLGLEKSQEAYKYTSWTKKKVMQYTPYEYRYGGGGIGGANTRIGYKQQLVEKFVPETKIGYREIDPLKDIMEQYGDDPFKFYYETMKESINQRIRDSEKESDEWFAARTDLWNLEMENLQRAKEQEEKKQQAMEDLFGKIEETLRMRLAEERKTAKGDIMFVDVGSSRDAQKWLDKMISAAKTNDPKAMELVEEFRKKMLGIRG